MPNIQLSPVEARILGSLVEKSLTTPELYPLTFNSLLNACNQKTSREPVMSLDVETLGKGIEGLIEKALISRFGEAGARVPKLKHYIDKLTGPDERVVGALCVLLLRGAQTAGEIKNRSERLCKFESTAEVDALLQELMAKPEPFIARLPRAPGQKEARYMQLFTGPAPEGSNQPLSAPAPSGGSASEERIVALEKRVEDLEAAVKALTGEKTTA